MPIVCPNCNLFPHVAAPHSLAFQLYSRNTLCRVPSCSESHNVGKTEASALHHSFKEPLDRSKQAHIIPQEQGILVSFCLGRGDNISLYSKEWCK